MMNQTRRVTVSFRWTVALGILMMIGTTGLFSQYLHQYGRIAPVVVECELPRLTKENQVEAASTGIKSLLFSSESGENMGSGQAVPMTQNIKSDVATSAVKKAYDAESVKKRFDTRMAQVLKVCQRSADYANISSLIHEERKVAFGRLTFCPIAKCGTTYIRRDLTPNLRKLDDRAGILFPESQRKTFYLVREPYSRLVSAFFSKMVGYPYWWKMTGLQIVKKFRPNASEFSIRCGFDVTFPEFIKYVINVHKTGVARDPHFVRMMEVCNICAGVPDFVAKLETVSDDMTYILKTVNVTGQTNSSFVEVQNLARLFMKSVEKYKNDNCGSMCTMLNRFWYGQQATGLISEDFDLPVKGQECEDMTEERLVRMSHNAYVQSTGRINKRELKKRVTTELFKQVPMADRRELQKMLRLECEIYEYDPEPSFVFPELYTT